MKGLLLVLLSSLIYGTEPSLRALALQDGVSPVSIILVNSTVFFLACAAICLVRHENVRLPWRQTLQLTLGGSAGIGITGLLVTMASRYIPVGCVTVIHFMYPSLVCIALAIRFKNRLTAPKLLAIVLSIVGLVCISGDSFGGSFFGIVLAVCSSLTFALYILVLDKGQTGSIRQSVRMFYVALGSCLALGILSLVLQEPGGWTPRSLGLISGCGILTCIASISFALGIKHIGSSAASFCSLLEPISSLVISTIIYHYSFSVTTLIGCALSVTAILLVSLNDPHIMTGKHSPIRHHLSAASKQ